MATPAYQGQGQPSATGGGGWFGRLGSFFRGSRTPAYLTAPASPPADTSKTEPDAQPGCGPITIIVPRPGCQTESECESG